MGRACRMTWGCQERWHCTTPRVIIRKQVFGGCGAKIIYAVSGKELLCPVGLFLMRFEELCKRRLFCHTTGAEQTGVVWESCLDLRGRQRRGFCAPCPMTQCWGEGKSSKDLKKSQF